MDGATLLRELEQALNESSTSAWVNDQLSYTYLYEAAVELNARMAFLTSSQDITTTASTSEYNLNPDFLGLYMRDSEREYFLRYYDGSAYSSIYHRRYEDIFFDNNTTTQSIPDCFSIKPATTAVSNVTGLATINGTVSNGEAILTDTTPSTQFSTIASGDLVHNTTSDYHGIVIAKTSSTALVTAIFNTTGTAQSWTAGDAYVVVPQGRFGLIVDPPNSTASHTITVPYIKKPDPVFAPYRSYPFPIECKRDLVEYAASRYKYRDRDPNFGDAFFKYFARTSGITSYGVKRSLNRGTFTMHMRKPQ
jgi:hypothetical protein